MARERLLNRPAGKCRGLHLNRRVPTITVAWESLPSHGQMLDASAAAIRKNAGAGIRRRSLARLDSTAAIPASAATRTARPNESTPPISAHRRAPTSPAVPLTKNLTSQVSGGDRRLKSGTLLRSLAFTVGADAFSLSFDLTGLSGNTSLDLAKYNSDVTQLRQYCKG